MKDLFTSAFYDILLVPYPSLYLVFLLCLMNAMNDYLDGLLEGPSGLTNDVSRLGPIWGRDCETPCFFSYSYVIYLTWRGYFRYI